MSNFWHACYNDFPEMFEKLVKYFGKDRFIVIENRMLHKALVDEYELLDFFDKKGMLIYMERGKESVFSFKIKDVLYSHSTGASVYGYYDVGEFELREEGLTESLLSCCELMLREKKL